MGAVLFGGCLVERRQSCVMRDGVLLNADIYRPDDRELHPVLLMRQPYGRELASTITQAHPLWYVQHGFIVIVQDVRGRGDSEGEFDPFVHEAEDGYDTVEWAAALPGSNGNVGMYGFSYQGSTQWAAASAAPPSLKAIAPGMCGADLYRGMIYPQGRFATAEHVPWAFQLARDSARRAGDAAAEAYCTRVRRHTPDELLYPTAENGSHPILQQYFPAYAQWYSHPEYDAYWERRNWMKACREKPVPAFLIGGWYDVFLMGTLLDYEELEAERPTRAMFHKLLVGPWDHIPWGRYSGGKDHGPEADGDVHEEQLRWFQYWLDPRADPASVPEAPVPGGEAGRNIPEPGIRYYERGSRRWHSMPQVQASRMRELGRPLRCWLGSTGKPANGAMGGGYLADTKPAAAATLSDVFVYDARLPMTLAGYQPNDRRMEQDRYEILVYTSPILTEPVRLFGMPRLAARIQTLGGPTDLVAILSVVDAEGTVTFLTAGITETAAEADESGSWHMAEVEMRMVGIELQAGEALRLELTGSAYPLFAQHPNGRPLKEAHRAGPEQYKMATVSVSYGQPEGSWLELPVLPREGE